ncbi:hypothetical protein ACQCSV_18270 [Pseudarthrobacter sp. S3]|uniref:hypothetical protein n=1 Tax=Pseudarthrobacter sp. S3 TaxID=3418419 RepID=UPI003CED7B7D
MKNHDGDQQLPVRPQVFNKQFPEQCGSKGSVPMECLATGGAKVSLRPEAGIKPGSLEKIRPVLPKRIRLAGWSAAVRLSGNYSSMSSARTPLRRQIACHLYDLFSWHSGGQGGSNLHIARGFCLVKAFSGLDLADAGGHCGQQRVVEG